MSALSDSNTTVLHELLLKNQAGTGANLLNEYIQMNLHNVAFYKELLQIFVKDTDRIGISAGLVLKNHIYNLNDPPFIQYICTELLQMPRNDRFRVGVIGTTLGKLYLHFPSIPISQHILELFISDPSIPMFNIIDRMCQEKELDFQPPHFALILQHLTDQGYVKFAFDIISNSIRSHHIDAFIPDLIIALIQVPLTYRQQSLQLLSKIAEYKSQLLMQSNFEAVLQYVFENFDLDASEFILSFTENNNFRDALQPYLGSLIPLILVGMQYTEEEVQSTLEDDEIQPRHHLTQIHNQVDQDDEDDVDFYGDWNFRKCCASCLDALSECFRNDLLPILLPLLQRCFVSTNWLEQEAGILALGAIADGCQQTITNYLNELIPFLISCSSHSQPLVISIALWTLSRFSSFICHSYDTDPGSYFEPTLSFMLQGLTHQQQKVQESACSALSVLSDDAAPILGHYKVPIMNAIVPCLQMYSKKNLMMLLDTLGALAYALQEDIRDQMILEAVIPPLLAYWQRLKMTDVLYLTLMDCLQHLYVAFGPLMAPYSNDILIKCGNSITIALENLCLLGLDSEYDPGHVLAGLDCLSGLLNGLGENSNLFLNFAQELNHIFSTCLQMQDVEMIQSVFGLLGEMTRFQPAVIQPHLISYYEHALHKMSLPESEIDSKAISNAVWFIGEYILLVNGAMPHIAMLASKLDILLGSGNHSDSIHASTLENTSVTLARVALFHPVVVLDQLKDHFDGFVSMLNLLHNTGEKISAYSGLYAMVALKNDSILPHVKMILHQISQCKTNEHDLHTVLKKVLYINIDYK